MNELGYIAALMVAVLAGMLFAFGLVLVYVFLGSSDHLCQTAVYSLVSTIL